MTGSQIIVLATPVFLLLIALAGVPPLVLGAAEKAFAMLAIVGLLWVIGRITQTGAQAQAAASRR